MFDKARLKFALENYKKDFPTWWQNEKYKWEAVKCFQDNWDINAKNFADMLGKSLAKLDNKLIYGQAKPIIIHFAKNEPETVREMFKFLYNESQEISERYENYKDKSEKLFKRYPYKDDINSHQTENTISAYLWLKYPDKYYIYNFTEVKTISVFLDYHHWFKKRDSADNIKNFLLLYDEINKELKLDSQLVKMLNDNLDNDCYSDKNFKILTVDFSDYFSEMYNILLEDWRNKNSGKNPLLLQQNEVETYTKENFLSEVFINDEKYNLLVNLLERKKNIILQGAPGVGKTFAAKRLAYSIIGEKNDNQIEFVQFHQNYSYEDFIMGYKPTENNFKMQTGIFYNFCKKAESEPGKKFFFIIDEINRGNMSKIFGELLMLIEKDHRAEKIKLAYKPDEYFSVPENLYIIGMMNTADRSLAIIDYALRRRFSFFEMEPAFDSDGFKKYQDNFQNEIFNKLIEQIKILNQEISADKTLGKGFCIGHSYFCNLESCTTEILRSIVEYEILPTLEEYYFDDENKLQDWKNNLRGVFND